MHLSVQMPCALRHMLEQVHKNFSKCPDNRLAQVLMDVCLFMIMCMMTLVIYVRRKLSGSFSIRWHHKTITNIFGSINMHEILSWSILKMACLFRAVSALKNYWILDSHWSSCLSSFHWELQNMDIQWESKFWWVFLSNNNYYYFKKIVCIVLVIEVTSLYPDSVKLRNLYYSKHTHIYIIFV